MEDWGQVSDPFQFSNLLQLLNNQLCQDSSVSFFFLKRWIRVNKIVDVNFKDGQISLDCHFNKIIKGPVISLQSPALSQKHVRNICHTAHHYLTKFHFDNTLDSKQISISVASIMQQCLWWRLKFWNLWISQKHKNLDISRTKHYFFFKWKKSVIHKNLLYAKK